jgi:hypothetical protein
MFLKIVLETGVVGRKWLIYCLYFCLLAGKVDNVI